MTDHKDIQAANIVQHFWESGLLLVGFIALFWWDSGPIALRVVLGLILVRACFSWSETAVLEKQIASMTLENQKRHAILQGLLFELDQKMEKSHENANDGEGAREAARIFVEKIENAERAFQEGYDRSSGIEEMLSPSVGARAWVSIGGTVFQIAVIAILAWGIIELIDRI